VRASYNEWLQAEPIMIDAAACGWVRRHRLYWLAGRAGAATPSLTAPPVGTGCPPRGASLSCDTVATNPCPTSASLAMDSGR
jgi:hypothetical protein